MGEMGEGGNKGTRVEGERERKMEEEGGGEGRYHPKGGARLRRRPYAAAAADITPFHSSLQHACNTLHEEGGGKMRRGRGKIETSAISPRQKNAIRKLQYFSLRVLVAAGMRADFDNVGSRLEAKE